MFIDPFNRLENVTQAFAIVSHMGTASCKTRFRIRARKPFTDTTSTFRPSRCCKSIRSPPIVMLGMLLFSEGRYAAALEHLMRVEKALTETSHPSHSHRPYVTESVVLRGRSSLKRRMSPPQTPPSVPWGNSEKMRPVHCLRTGLRLFVFAGDSHEV